MSEIINQNLNLPNYRFDDSVYAAMTAVLYS